jgi:PTH1 family peptidyl-tRNA hydrolase
LIQSLGSEEFARVRIGIGRPQSKDSEVVAKYVLEQFEEEEMRAIRGLAYQAVLEILKKEAFIL